MKHIQTGAAALALLLTLAGCASEPQNISAVDPPVDTPITTPDTDSAGEQTPEDSTAPEISVFAQPDTHTVTADDEYAYSLAQVGAVNADGHLPLRIVHDFAPGEQIDFRSTELSGFAFTGEEFFLGAAEGLTCYVYDGTQWQAEERTLTEGEYVYLTSSPDGTSLHAITLTETTGEPQPEPVEEQPTEEPVDDTIDEPTDATTP